MVLIGVLLTTGATAELYAAEEWLKPGDIKAVVEQVRATNRPC
jgi:hypothetical protein